jgi:hypothetical protein
MVQCFRTAGRRPIAADLGTHAAAARLRQKRDDQPIQWTGQQVQAQAQAQAQASLHGCFLDTDADLACGRAARADATQGQVRRCRRPLSIAPMRAWPGGGSRPCLKSGHERHFGDARICPFIIADVTAHGDPCQSRPYGTAANGAPLHAGTTLVESGVKNLHVEERWLCDDGSIRLEGQ